MNDENLAKWSVDELENEIATIGASIAAETARQLELLSELERRGAWATQGFDSIAHWLAFRTSVDLGTAREHVRVALALRALPCLAGGLRKGELSYSKVRAATRIAKPETDADLCAMAREATTAQLERIVRTYRRACPEEGAKAAALEEKRELQAFYDDDGMLVLRGRLAADEGALFLKALDAMRESIYGKQPASAESPPAQRRADALVRMADRSLGGGEDRVGGDRAMIVVHVDAEVLADPSVEGRSELEHGPGVSAETSRRLACDASVVVMARQPSGEPVAGRRKRLLSAALRRAMLARDGAHCTFPGCSSRIVDGHHCRHWINGGETVLGNITGLCRSCHVRVHEGGWRAEVTPNGTRFFRPDGRELRVPRPPPARPLVPPPGANPWTLAPRWDGTPIDYAWAAEALIARERH